LSGFTEITSHNNWFQIIRESLGMSTRYLAKKMGITHGRVAQLQKAESNGSITLRNLQKLANSLECEMIYAFVPQKSLEDIIETKAKEIAKECINRVAHSMSLEQQGTSKEALKTQYEELVQELISQHPKKLWKE
jgi:predicted DNA-binding mobile mystery protein A